MSLPSFQFQLLFWFHAQSVGEGWSRCPAPAANMDHIELLNRGPDRGADYPSRRFI